jgi:hypothetical protein
MIRMIPNGFGGPGVVMGMVESTDGPIVTSPAMTGSQESCTAPNVIGPHCYCSSRLCAEPFPPAHADLICCHCGKTKRITLEPPKPPPGHGKHRIAP